MEAARAALSAAGERQQRLDALIAEEQAKLDAINANRASRGSGRPPGAEARRVAAIERKLDRLKRGELPDDAGAGASSTCLRRSASERATASTTSCSRGCRSARPFIKFYRWRLEQRRWKRRR